MVIFVAKSIMIQGTMSNAGKSFVAAALCRIFKRDGYKTAPFKSQNMALNSYITPDGLEIGRAQAMQAAAAGIEPSVLMNPILLKPTDDRGSQVIVNGEVRGYMNAADYFKYKKRLVPDIMNAYRALESEYDIIVIEGAGSPAEINLKSGDIVNMGMAKMADAPVVIVGDIDRGGVFAQLYGTVALLDASERERVKAFIINKFRGDADILRPGLEMIEDMTGIKVAGALPYGRFNIEDEDSLSDRLLKKSASLIDIAVIRFPRISNFTDLDVFSCFDGVGVRYVDRDDELKDPDMIILPGSKNTIGDLMWMRRSGLEAAIKKSGCPIFGICGGYQMLGGEITDGTDTVRGMGLLPVTTRFYDSKTRARVEGAFSDIEGDFAFLNGVGFEGYEIHMGQSELIPPARPAARLSDGRSVGAARSDVMGTYVHGVFDKCAGDVIRFLCGRKGLRADDIKNVSMSEVRQREYDRLADMVRSNLDMELIYKIVNGEV